MKRNALNRNRFRRYDIFLILVLFQIAISSMAFSSDASCAKTKIIDANNCSNILVEIDVSSCRSEKISATNRQQRILKIKSCKPGKAVAVLTTKAARYFVQIDAEIGIWDTISWEITKPVQIRGLLKTKRREVLLSKVEVPVVKNERQTRAPSSIPNGLPPQIGEGRKEAEDVNNSKDDYSLFHPVPQDRLRDFTTNRPASQISPYTIDAGHVQIELEAFNYSRLSTDIVDSATSVKTTSVNTQINFPNPDLRIGLTNASEIEIAWVPQVTHQVKVAGAPDQTTSGIGDINLRFKENMLGNDGGTLAWAILTGIKIPTNSNGVGNKAWEPTLMFPFGIILPGDWGFAIMPELDMRKNASNDAYHFEFNAPFTVGRHLFGPFDGFLEFVSHSSSEDGALWTNFFGAGFAVKLAKEMQIDLACNFGLNSITPQVNPYAGWVVRF
jgi:hypothetical protein